MINLTESEHGPVVAEPAPNQATLTEDAVANAKSTKSPAFQFYPKDFLSSSKVRKMSLTEIGAYTVLLATSWLDGSLPNDLPELARTLGVKEAQFRRMWAGPLGQCFYEKNGRLLNDRLEDERKKQAEFRRRQGDNGRLGGRPKKAVGSDEKGLGFSGLTQTEPKKSSSSAFASSSALCTLQKDTYGQPIIARRRLDAAWEGAKGLYVPQRKHADFIQLRNHPDADRELCAWYESVAESWQGSPGADMMKFWTARYDEKWPATVAPKAVRSNQPQWIQDAAARKAGRS